MTDISAQIAQKIKFIEKNAVDDVSVVAEYQYYSGKYIEAIADSTDSGTVGIVDAYINREAYRIVANIRGYSDDVLLP